MAFDKIFFLAVVLAIAGLQRRVVADEDFDHDADQQWAAGGMSPLDSLAYWDSQASPAESQEEINDARGCCMPKTWTSTLFSEIRREGRRQKGRALRFAEVAYVDQNNQRVATDVRIPHGPHRNATTISYIILFNNTPNASSATLYAFCKTARKCYKKVLKGAQFRPMCLPPNATLQASYTLGAGAGALQSQSWGFIVRDRRAAIVGSIVLTPANCVPILVGERVYTRPRVTDEDLDIDRKRLQITTVGALYTNFVTEVRDPSVFTPPSYCNKDDDNDDTLLFSPDIDFTPIIQRFVTVP